MTGRRGRPDRTRRGPLAREMTNARLALACLGVKSGPPSHAGACVSTRRYLKSGSPRRAGGRCRPGFQGLAVSRLIRRQGCGPCRCIRGRVQGRRPVGGEGADRDALRSNLEGTMKNLWIEFVRCPRNTLAPSGLRLRSNLKKYGKEFVLGWKSPPKVRRTKRSLKK